jgi:hypothetical protein
MILRALAVWLVMLLLAVVNGAVRQAWLIPKLGAVTGRLVSTITLSALIAVVTWFTIAWIRPQSNGDSYAVGVLWITLTLAFEFLAGHFLFGSPCNELLEDYNLLRGRIWPLVLVTMVVAPRLCAIYRGLVRPQG